MKRLDRFIIKSFIGPFIMTFLVVMFVLVLQFLWLYIDELVGKGLSFGVILEFMGWGAATLMPNALPLATLLASIMTLGGMGENNELLAMKAAGISLGRILTPLIAIALLISVGAFFVSNNLIPVAYKNIYTLQYDINKTKDEIKIPTGIFYDGIDGYIIRVDTENKETGMMYDVMVYDHTSTTGNNNLTIADSSLMRLSADQKNMVFTLYNGCNYVESNKLVYRDTTLSLQRIDFREQELIVPLENYAFSRSEEGRFDDQVMAKNLSQLKVDRDSLTIKMAAEDEEQLRRAKFSLGLQFSFQFDEERSSSFKGVMPVDSLKPKYFSARSKSMAMHDARNATDEAIRLLEGFERNEFRYVDPIRRNVIESFRKFTLSLACLIFFFIGAPLGAIIRKGGLGIPVIISILFFAAYWVVDISGKKLARDGSMSPFMGTFISSFVLMPIGAFLTWTSTKDSAIFNPTVIFKAIKAWMKDLLDRRKRKKVKIAFMGTPEFAVSILDAIYKKGYTVSTVVTVPDKASGRGLKINESAVKKYATEHKLPLLQPVSLKDPEFIQQLKDIDADIFVVVAFRMLPKEVWSLPKLGTFNLHASLLPQYRGAAPINWAIINGHRITGLTTFLIDENIDTGNILFTKECLIENSDTFETLHDKMMPIGAGLVLQTIEALVTDRYAATPQVIDPDDPPLPAPKLNRENRTISWNKSAKEVWCHVRGLSPYPAALSTISSEGNEVEVKIFAGEVLTKDTLPQNLQEKITAETTPGTIITDGKKNLIVACSEGYYRITELQASGKKRMESSAFLAGARDIENFIFQ